MAEWSGQPAYKQVAEELRRRIREGQISAGEKLPSIAALMDEFGVSITVVRMALSELRAGGLITTHQGKGAFVREGVSARQALGDLTELWEVVNQLSDRVDALEAKRSRGRGRGA